jgi:hypothetical protein
MWLGVALADFSLALGDTGAPQNSVGRSVIGAQGAKQDRER